MPSLAATPHRDTYSLELTAPSGVTIATLSICNDDAGFAQALAWIVEQAPGPQIVAALEGTRSYGIGLARAPQVVSGSPEIHRPSTSRPSQRRMIAASRHPWAARAIRRPASGPAGVARTARPAGR